MNTTEGLSVQRHRDKEVTPQILPRPGRTFGEVAEALRTGVEAIAAGWEEAARDAIPKLSWNRTQEPQDYTPGAILMAVADALETADSRHMQRVIWESKIHGLARFRINFEIRDAMVEDRLARGVILKDVEELLGRPLDAAEFAALAGAIDMVLQHTIFTIVEQQKAQLRKNTESEHKHLAFLNHELNNNLSTVTLSLTHLRLQLESECEKNQAALMRAEQSIINTVGGMKRLIEYERLRSCGERPPFVSVELRALGRKVAGNFCDEAKQKGLNLSVDVAPDMIAVTDPPLVHLILQNFVGNAMKYSTSGTVKVGCDVPSDGHGPTLWVSDEGPGIKPQHVEKIFEAFRRGDTFGKEGAGLGLAIAAQAAKLLDAKLSLISQLGKGSVFRVTFPAKSAEQPKG
jgi:signal transduction histidine kinase